MTDFDRQWKGIYRIGGIATIIVLCGIVIDMVVGAITGGDIASLPQTAIGRFEQYRSNWLLGLYNLDLLNAINQLLMIPTVFALYAAHRKDNNANALFALILFLMGTTIFIINNSALAMLDLSHKYFGATSDIQKNIIAAAGEALLVKGAHGSLGVFIGFALPTFANILMSIVMIKGKIFGKPSSWIGLFGNVLLLIYLVLVTFLPSTGKIAIAIAMPGGLLVMAWMILFTIRLFNLRKARSGEN